MKKRFLGLSILEVVIATGILIIVGTTLVSIMTFGLQNLKRAKALTIAQTLSQQKIEEGMQKAPNKLDPLSGTFSGYSGYSYSAAYTQNAAVPTLQDLIVTVLGPFQTKTVYAATVQATYAPKLAATILCEGLEESDTGCTDGRVYVSAIAKDKDIYIKADGMGGGGTTRYKKALFKFTYAAPYGLTSAVVSGLTFVQVNDKNTGSAMLTYTYNDSSTTYLCILKIWFNYFNTSSNSPQLNVVYNSGGGKSGSSCNGTACTSTSCSTTTCSFDDPSNFCTAF